MILKEIIHRKSETLEFQESEFKLDAPIFLYVNK